VSEVLYDPVIEEPGGEWIEIYNAGEVNIDLSNYKIGDSADRNLYEGMYQFPAGASIAPSQVIVIAIQANFFTDTYGFYPDYEMTDSDPLVDNLTPYIDWSIGSVFLGNTGDEVLLLDGEDNLVDSLSWGNSSWAFEPPIPTVAEGHSLERHPANEDHDSAADWYDQAVPNPGFVE
jgi:glycerophosphoryl diester phosphodiesterase